ncbi:hypothetical protein chiPu_0013724 [Chiloscyllium punctatum]|uniref:Uncharacterized protein n=1 Tax=Chiloscyllium punctatum TaxID=137246 RepID=A0A401SXX6_CHIPU|nr:hypothetical protein [Chiloscyllium punctatum]
MGEKEDWCEAAHSAYPQRDNNCPSSLLQRPRPAASATPFENFPLEPSRCSRGRADSTCRGRALRLSVIAARGPLQLSITAAQGP